MTDGLRWTLLTVSNIGWLVPALLAFQYESMFWCVVPMCMFLFSALYHMTENKQLEILDTISALLFFLCGPVLLIQSGALRIEWFISLIATLVAVSLYLIARLYRLRGETQKQVIAHCAWHLASSGLATAIYLIYFGYIQM